MAHYRQIDTRIWNDAKFCSLTSSGKLAFVFVLSHPNQTMLGAMRASVQGLASEFFASSEQYTSQALLKGLPKGFNEGFTKPFWEAIDKGMVRYDEKASLIWLPNFLKYNRPQSPNVIKAWPGVFDLLPECELKHHIYQQLDDYSKGLTKAFRDAFLEVFTKDFRKTSPNQEQEQEQDKDRNTASQYSFPPQSNHTRSLPCELPTSNGKSFPITAAYLSELEKAYSGVDLFNEFERMRLWLDAQPGRKKKPTGMKRFIVGWLNRAKNETAKPKAKAASAEGREGRKANRDGSYKI